LCVSLGELADLFASVTVFELLWCRPVPGLRVPQTSALTWQVGRFSLGDNSNLKHDNKPDEESASEFTGRLKAR